MDRQTQTRMEAQAEVFKALAHPSRMLVVHELAQGERCVCELTELIGADKSTVSKHLSILKQAGIVNDDKRGTNVFYSLQATCVLNFIGCVEAMVAKRAQEQAALLAQ